ncbi:hypothetical protein AB205_0191520 [Aquarana catesbeiana]|uniref:Uncharacterized protein n=1 Tax=Aquarana catesbeiana TaxID=8400 RepID=A0A2G9NAS8_AQUCT|nr:hypothetical protein AB205_0191520 [Aquarana catesbeiana]
MFHIPFSALQYLCAKYTFFYSHRGEKTGTSEDTKDPPPPKEGEVTKTQAEDEEGEVLEVGKIVTTAGDVDVVEKESNFTSESAQILSRERMGCNRDFENLKQNINDVQKKLRTSLMF